MNLQSSTPKELFSFSGKIGSGKDTATQIFQMMTCDNVQLVKEFYEDPETTLNAYTGLFEMDTRFENIKYADQVKKVVAALLGKTVREVDHRDFKEKELGPEWWYYHVDGKMIAYNDSNLREKDAKELEQYLVKHTPRSLQQIIATEGGRDLIHPDIWINATFNRCKPNEAGDMPSWVISDVRFKNELKAVLDRDGVAIRIIRYKQLSEWLADFEIDLNMDDYDNVKISDRDFLNFINELDSPSLTEVSKKLNHRSEVELDSVEFKYTIHNDGSIVELVNAIREILIKEGVELTETVGVTK